MHAAAIQAGFCESCHQPLDLVQNYHIQGNDQEQIAQIRNQALDKGIQAAKIDDDPLVDRPCELQNRPDFLGIRLPLKMRRVL